MKVQGVQSYLCQPKFKADTYDIFTGLKDKTTLLSDIGNQMREKEDISIAMFDMDNFKSVNEILGYKAGDEFIKAIGSDISKVAKNKGVDAYRFGGDEFVVLVLNNMNDEEKESLVTEVQETIANNKTLSEEKNEYIKNIGYLVGTIEGLQHKVNEVELVANKYEVYRDLYKNATIARQDPHVIKSMYLLNKQRNKLLNRVYKETNSGSTQERIEAYKEKYDRSHDLHRIRKWYKDFKKQGFHISGGVITFEPNQYRGKEPIDLINETGELLKQKKH